MINSLETGGAEGALVNLSTNDQLNEHVIISLKGGAGYSKLIENSAVKVHNLELRGFSNFFNVALNIRRIILRENPDILQSWMYHSNLICSILLFVFRLQIKLYWNIRHSTISFRNDKFSLIFVIAVCAIISRLTTVRIIYCAKEAMRSHLRLGFSKNRNRIIGNGYKPYLSALPNLHSVKSEFDQFNLGYIARYHPQKNHLKLFECIAKLKSEINIHVTLAGKGCDTQNLKLVSILEQMGLLSNVTLNGLIEEPRSLMHDCDYTLLISDYGEGFPNVIGESLSVGTPCITTNVGDAKLILNNCGRVVPTSSVDDLVEQLKIAWDIRKDYTRYRKLRQQCVKTYEEHLSVSQMCKSYIHYWKSS